MIIVCTQDAAVRNNTNGAAGWGVLNLLSSGGQPGATAQLGGFAARVGTNEALCLSAHGNNAEIGDAGPRGWVWNADDIARILQGALPVGYNAPILISACATNVVNFSAALAHAFRVQRWRGGLFIYGYNTALGATASYPNSANLDANVSLQPTRV